MPQIEDGPVGQRGLIVERPLTGGPFLEVWQEALERQLDNNDQRNYFKGMGPPCLSLLSYSESRQLLGGVTMQASELGGYLLRAIPGLSDPYSDPLQITGVRFKITPARNQYLCAKISPRAGEHDSPPVAEQKAIYAKCSSMVGARPSTPERPPVVLLASIGSKSLVAHSAAMQRLYSDLDNHFQGQHRRPLVEEGEFGMVHTIPAAAALPPKEELGRG